MKAYVMTTGAIFGLLVVAHIWRVIAERPGLAKDRRTSSLPSLQPFYASGPGACCGTCRVRSPGGPTSGARPRGSGWSRPRPYMASTT